VREHLSGKRKLDTTQPMSSIKKRARTNLGFTTATSDRLKLEKGEGSSVKRTDIDKWWFGN